MNIKVDSRKVEEGDTFVALKGVNDDGHKYVMDAIANGAKKVVVHDGLYSVETLVVKDTHEYLINYLKENYYDEIKDMKLIGITGTNGKTTSCYLLWQALNKLGIKAAYIGTIGFYINDCVKMLDNTTPDILDLYEMFLESKKQGCQYVVMEVSSHSLSFKRVGGLKFDYAIFTNLTQDHLDYHDNMKNYALAKQELFKNVKDDGYAIVNIDDDYHKYYLLENHNITYGQNPSDYQIVAFKDDMEGSNFKIKHEEVIAEYQTHLIGKYNIYNLINTIIVLKNEKFKSSDIYNIVSELSEPPGRVEKIKLPLGLVIIDYAHTPDAVAKVIKAIKELAKGKVYTVVGCGGNRDKKKRPLMGKIATDLSDYVIFTSDNPRKEDPLAIINDIVQNLDNKNYEIEENREKALFKGIQKLSKNDILLVLGKGHEDYQVIGDEKIHFSDKEMILKNIRR